MLYLKLILCACKLFILGIRMSLTQRRAQRLYAKCASYTDPKLVRVTNRYASMCVAWTELEASFHEIMSLIEEKKL